MFTEKGAQVKSFFDLSCPFVAIRSSRSAEEEACKVACTEGPWRHETTESLLVPSPCYRFTRGGSRECRGDGGAHPTALCHGAGQDQCAQGIDREPSQRVERSRR